MRNRGGAVLVVLGMMGCGKDEPKATTMATVTIGPSAGAESGQGASAAASAPPPKVELTPEDEVVTKTSFQEALAFAKPLMGDAYNDVNRGASVFAAWAGKKMQWADVAVKDDETTPKLVMKDPDEQRGKRMCFTGKIVQIAVKKTPYGKMTHGILSVGYYDRTLFHFMNVGSSGSIVEDDQARFCGIVIGKYDYQNSGGGTGHAIQVVGMWDIAENKPDGGK